MLETKQCVYVSGTRRQEAVDAMMNGEHPEAVAHHFGVSRRTAYYWLTQERKALEPPSIEQFREIAIRQESPPLSPPASRLEIEFPNGIRISGLDADGIASLLEKCGVTLS